VLRRTAAPVRCDCFCDGSLLLDFFPACVWKRSQKAIGFTDATWDEKVDRLRVSAAIGRSVRTCLRSSVKQGPVLFRYIVPREASFARIHFWI
jgi:hypothetical protein